MKTLGPETISETLHTVGRPVRRPDAPEKVKGTALYVDDLHPAGTLYARVVRSPHAHARILRIEAEGARSVPGVRAVLTAADIPGKNIIPVIQEDWPLLADQVTHHVGEAVALVAAESREAAAEAAERVQVLYEPLPPVLTIEEGFEREDFLARWKILRGDAETAFQDPDLVVLEHVYRTPYQEHAYLETNGVLAMPDGLGGICVYGSLQCPHYVQKAVSAVLGLDMAKVRIVQMCTGGGFGGKEDAPSAPGSHCALLAWKTGRPVKLVLTREEDMLCMSKRHPGKVRYRMACARDGRILAVDVDYWLNGGAYATLSPVVLWRGIVHAAGPYKVPHVRVHAYAVRTDTVPCGAFRGFGEPQIVFAVEAHVDAMAEKLGLDPVEFRRRNLLDYGDETVTGHALETSVGMSEVLERVLEKAEWNERHALYSRPQQGRYRKGLGLAASYYGVGLGALGKHLNPAAANVVVSADGSVTVAVGTTEIGQGMITVLTQIAAEEFGCEPTRIRLVESDTSRVPDSGPTVASRTTLMSGNAVRDACRQIKQRMEPHLEGMVVPWKSATFQPEAWPKAVAACLGKCVQLASQGWSVPPATTFDVETGQGHPYVTYTWSANTVEVTVDTETGEVVVDRVVSGHDVGKIINPQTGQGQIEGGAMQGLGYALVEEHHTRDGRILNNQFSTYIIPTPMDTPELIPVIVEHRYPWGPYGAKGLGETPMIAVAPAVVNAIAQAVGCRLREIPATPERVWEAMNP
ncbi:MAG: xanthine dehydrogenase family protein molybdopterin-binding subunit [Candidatus Eremiobacterota bacterium]